MYSQNEESIFLIELMIPLPRDGLNWKVGEWNRVGSTAFGKGLVPYEKIMFLSHLANYCLTYLFSALFASGRS